MGIQHRVQQMRNFPFDFLLKTMLDTQSEFDLGGNVMSVMLVSALFALWHTTKDPEIRSPMDSCVVIIPPDLDVVF